MIITSTNISMVMISIIKIVIWRVRSILLSILGKIWWWCIQGCTIRCIVGVSSSRVGLGRVMGCLLGRLFRVTMKMPIKAKSRNRRSIIPEIPNKNNKHPPNNRNHPPKTTTTTTQIKNTNQNKTQPATSNQPQLLPTTTTITTNPRNRKLIRTLQLRVKLYWMIMIFHQ